MMAIRPTTEAIQRCMRSPEQIRNVCILAHVDHGKTTISDSLLATNGLISKRSAGTMRYLDDRRDEQERGITMKSSAVALYYTFETPTNGHFDENKAERMDGAEIINDAEKMNGAMPKCEEMVLNLIDTPGHIDFSSEVAAAIRISDGALIVVDLVEGVCVQTKEAIKQAYEEKIKMILVVNKIDRLIIELSKSVDDIFRSILRVIENSNAYIAELKRFDLECEDEEHDAEFSPEIGNVIFASAVDGWGFTLEMIAEMFTGVIPNESVESLTHKLWDFDNYIDSSKTILSGAIDKKKDNLFVQLCLKTVYYVYFTLVTRMERQKLDLIVKKLNISQVTREMSNNNPKIQVKAILQSWKPLSHTIMQQVRQIVPSPKHIDEVRFRYLVNAHKFAEDESANVVENLIQNFKTLAVDTSVVYVSKMFSVSKKNLSQNKPKLFMPSKEDREAIILARKAREALGTLSGIPLDAGTPINVNEALNVVEDSKMQPDSKKYDSNMHIDSNMQGDSNPDNGNVPDLSLENTTVALARVFSGTITEGQELYLIPANYNPNRAYTGDGAPQKVRIEVLYVLLGRELVRVDSVPSGNICGIGGIESSVQRTATLSNSLNTPPLMIHYSIEPIVRNSIEPKDPKLLPNLRNALKLLTQTDSCVQVSMQETGELVLLTAGDVHLAKCLEDLKTKFADIAVNVSEPMVSLRETILSQRKINDFRNTSFNVTCELKDFGFALRVLAVPLPQKVAKFFESNHQLLRWVEEHQQKSAIDILLKKKSMSSDSSDSSNSKDPTANEKVYKTEHTKLVVSRLKEQLKNTFAGCKTPWVNMSTKVWSVGKNKDPINVLFNATSDYSSRNIFSTLDEGDVRSLLDHCVVNAFEMACKSGPMCEEPIANCAFIVTKYHIADYPSLEAMDNKTQVVANVPVALRTAFRDAFEKQARRLMEPIFTTDIQVNTSILGKVYSVLNKRQGKIQEAMGMDEQEKMFLVKAQIPVVESDGFANEIRKTTSGEANPNLRFSHYEIIDGDPYYEPDSEDSDEDTAAIERANRASRLMKDVRRRKGLHVDEQVVVHAEKQRTLNKKK